MMRMKLSAISSRNAARLAGAVCLTSLAAGCSSDMSRFQDGLFTGTVPNAIGASQASARPAPQRVNAPVYAAPAVAQPYPGDVTNGDYDRTYTGSIPRTDVRSAPAYPPAPQQVTYQSQPPVYQPAVVRQPLRQPPVQATKPDVRLVPVPNVVGYPNSNTQNNNQPAPVTRTVRVPVHSIPTPQSANRSSAAPRTVAAAPQPYPAQQPYPARQPDPVITGTTPANTPVQTSVNGAGQASTASGWSAAGGTSVQVGPGETLYNLSRRYGVPAKEIMKANNISDPSRVYAGQVVVIPTYVYSRKAPVSAPDNNPTTRASRSSTGFEGQAQAGNIPVPTPAPARQRALASNTVANRQPVLQRKPADNPQPSVAAAQDSRPANIQAAPVQAVHVGSQYTVQSGDSLSKIASNAGISVAALKNANGLDQSTIRIGQKLRIPRADSSIDTVRTASVPVQKTTASKSSARVESTPSGTVAEQSAVKGNAPKATGIGKLRWPAHGQVMNQFGAVNDGARNDGIDISLPQGTPVKAAENGVVIYAGSGLKEYGNTVLVRHDNGLVSVYGHASELIVQRGDNVTRGQVVALSGMSGQASRPKLHFEIRKDAKPVNPITYLE